MGGVVVGVDEGDVDGLAARRAKRHARSRRVAAGVAASFVVFFAIVLVVSAGRETATAGRSVSVEAESPPDDEPVREITQKWMCDHLPSDDVDRVVHVLDHGTWGSEQMTVSEWCYRMAEIASVPSDLDKAGLNAKYLLRHGVVDVTYFEADADPPDSVEVPEAEAEQRLAAVR
jgi:hypothetical protein